MIAGFIEAGDIAAFNAAQSFQDIPAGLPFQPHGLDQAGHFHNGGFRVADHKAIDEGGQWLRVKGAGAARDHDGVILRAAGGQHGDLPQVEHLQHIGEAHLILKREADDVKITQGRSALQRKQGDILPPHVAHHVHPGHHHPLAEHIGLLIQNVIEYLHPQVAHSHLIAVGETESKGRGFLLPGLDRSVHFAADIARGLLHRGQQPVNGCQLFFVQK